MSYPEFTLPSGSEGLDICQRHSPPCGECKLAPCFVGHFPISKVVNLVAVCLQLPRSLKIHPTFHVSRVKPLVSSHFGPSFRPLPPNQLIDGAPAFNVRRFLCSRWRGWGLHHLADWEGYGPEDHSWVPVHNIPDKILIQDFHRTHLDQSQGPCGAGPEGWDYVVFSANSMSCSLPLSRPLCTHRSISTHALHLFPTLFKSSCYPSSLPDYQTHFGTRCPALYL